MIFITVGTHEQPFDRLIKYVDELKGRGIIQEEVIIQTGFTEYQPKYCKARRLFSYLDIKKYIEEARIVITHGGPASFIMPLQIGKIPIVVPRKYEFSEHINDHQVEFTQAVCERQGNIIPVYEIEELEGIINNYDTIISSMSKSCRSNNNNFNEKLEKLIEGLCVG